MPKILTLALVMLFGSHFAYVASGAYRSQPEFQRFIEARAAALRAKGEQVELMK